jgi:hypothetical protein
LDEEGSVMLAYIAWVVLWNASFWEFVTSLAACSSALSSDIVLSRWEIPLLVNETLDHIPSSCVVVMVHVVKGRQYSAYTVPHAGASLNRRDGV